jgi:ATP-dependent Clp protease protease subunit
MSKSKKCKNCEECDGEEGYPQTGGIRDGVWNTFIQQKKIIITESISDSLIEKAVLQIYAINNYDDEQEATYVGFKRTPIEVFINTNGGTLDEAFSLISAIETSKTPVHTIALGKAWSAGFLILLAGHVRFAQPWSNLMYHQGSAGITSEFSKAIEYAEYWKRTQRRVEEYVASRTKIKKKKLRKIFHHSTDWYITTEEAIKHGVIEGIYGVDYVEEESE